MKVFELIKILNEYPHDWDVTYSGRDDDLCCVGSVRPRTVTEMMPQYKEGIEGPTRSCYYDGGSCWVDEVGKLSPEKYPIRFVAEVGMAEIVI